MVREVLVLSATRLQEHHVPVATAFADDLPAVRGDRVGLLQVLLNLVSSAIDAMEGVERSERRITIMTSRLDQSAIMVPAAGVLATDAWMALQHTTSSRTHAPTRPSDHPFRGMLYVLHSPIEITNVSRW